MPFAATQMDLEIIKLSGVSQAKTFHLYVGSKKKHGANELIYKMETESQ